MKIEESMPTVIFWNLERGECFTLPNDPSGLYYMAIEHYNSNCTSSRMVNAVNLRNGNVIYIDHGTPVIRLTKAMFLPYGQ